MDSINTAWDSGRMCFRYDRRYEITKSTDCPFSRTLRFLGLRGQSYGLEHTLHMQWVQPVSQ